MDDAPGGVTGHVDGGQATDNFAILEAKVWHDVPKLEQPTEQGHQSPALLGLLLPRRDRAVELVGGGPGRLSAL
jgi:hypothetical protein